MKITLKQMEIFTAIAKTQNMTLAADKLFLSQSACSIALATLESQLNGPLFDRIGKRLLLNERGRVFQTKAINILAQIEELQTIMADSSSKELVGTLKIGASSTIGNYLLPQIIGDFVGKYPKVKINLKVANTVQLIQQLQQFNIDIGFIEGSCFSEDIQVQHWKTDELIIIAAPNHPLKKQKQISLKQLENYPWILRETGSGTREQFEHLMGGTITPFLELGHTEAIKQAVRLGLGISCVSKETVADSLKNKELIKLNIAAMKLHRNFSIISQKEKYQTILLKNFIKILYKIPHQK